MPKNPIVREFVRKFDEVQYEIDAHHWLLAVLLFVLGVQIVSAWSFTDLRDGLLAAATGQQNINKTVLSLQQEIASLREDVTKLQRNGDRHNTPEETTKADAVMAPSPAQPGSATMSGSDGPRPKLKRNH